MSGSSGQKENGGSSSLIPDTRLKEAVKNLKEIVNCTEQDIRAMLLECNMDADEAAHRLLTQDMFHEVKSKRYKKKETKGIDRSQRVSTSSSDHGVSGAGPSGCSNTQTNSYDSDVSHAKPVHKKESGVHIIPAPSILRSGAAANNNSSSWGAAHMSNNDAIGNAVQAPKPSGYLSLPSQPSLTPNLNWMRGQLSMADIVRMGRPQHKPASSQVLAAEVHNSSQGNAGCMPMNISSEANHQLQSSQDNVIKAANAGTELSTEVGHHESLDGWTSLDHPDGEPPDLLDASGSFRNYLDRSTPSLHVDGTNVHLSPHASDIQSFEGSIDGETLASDSLYEVLETVDNFDGSMCSEDSCSYWQHEAEGTQKVISSTADNSHHQSSPEEGRGAWFAEGNPAVIFPSHLQVTNADFSHLSLGNFRSGAVASTPASFSTKPAQSNSEATSVTENASPINNSDYRYTELYNIDQSRRTTPGHIVSPVTGTNSRNNYFVSASQPEVVKDSTYITDQAVQHGISSDSSLPFANTAQSTDAIYNHAESRFSIQNLSHCLNSMHPHIDSFSSNLMAGYAQRLRESDAPPQQLLGNQSVPTNYDSATSPLTESSISMPEVLNSALLSTLQLYPQATFNTRASNGPAIPAYSESTILINQPQRVGYMPFSGSSASHRSPGSLQTAGMRYATPQFRSGMSPHGYIPFSGSSASHHSPDSPQTAGMRYATPQFRSGISPHGFPQSIPSGSGYGGFRSTTNTPASFLQNPTNPPVGSEIRYEEALRAQYKKTVPLHQCRELDFKQLSYTCKISLCLRLNIGQ